MSSDPRASRFALPVKRPIRFSALAAPTAIATFLFLVLTAVMIESLLAKLTWWETEDWAMPSFLLIGFAWPGALIAYAVTRRILVGASPGIDRPWVVRVLGMPFFLLPLFALVAWAPWAPFESSVNTPDRLMRVERLTQLGYYAAIALTIALWGWIVPRATLRGQLRAATIATAAVVALVVVQSLREMHEPAELALLGFFAPLALACGVAWRTTGSRKIEGDRPPGT